MLSWRYSGDWILSSRRLTVSAKLVSGRGHVGAQPRVVDKKLPMSRSSRAPALAVREHGPGPARRNAPTIRQLPVAPAPGQPVDDGLGSASSRGSGTARPLRGVVAAQRFEPRQPADWICRCAPRPARAHGTPDGPSVCTPEGLGLRQPKYRRIADDEQHQRRARIVIVSRGTPPGRSSSSVSTASTTSCASMRPGRIVAPAQLAQAGDDLAMPSAVLTTEPSSLQPRLSAICLRCATMLADRPRLIISGRAARRSNAAAPVAGLGGEQARCSLQTAARRCGPSGSSCIDAVAPGGDLQQRDDLVHPGCCARGKTASTAGGGRPSSRCRSAAAFAGGGGRVDVEQVAGAALLFERVRTRSVSRAAGGRSVCARRWRSAPTAGARAPAGPPAAGAGRAWKSSSSQRHRWRALRAVRRAQREHRLVWPDPQMLAHVRELGLAAADRHRGC